MRFDLETDTRASAITLRHRGSYADKSSIAKHRIRRKS